MEQARLATRFSENAQKVLCKRYLLPRSTNGECILCGQRHEVPEQMLDRVSMGSLDYYNMMARLDFLPNSPTLFNAGTGQGTYSACFKFDVEDSMESIMDVARKSAFVQKWGGGVGYCLSELRPKGALIKTTHGKACGPVAVLGLYQSVSKMITQGGKRAGAQIAVLHCEHPDIKEFIHCKDEGSDALSTFNLSVACAEEFMSKATQHSDTSEAKLLREMAESAWKTGDPGVYFIDTAEKANPTPHLGRLTGVNPCGETPLLDNEPCNLGSINLAKFITFQPHRTDATSFDYRRLEQVTRLAVRYLDEVLDHNAFPDEAITQAANRTRKLGLGVMGLADALAMMCIHYDSDEAVAFGDKVMKSIQVWAHNESEKLALDKGHYPASNHTGADRRNATLTCIAPSGTISVLAGCSSGIEPHYALENERMMGDGTILKEKVDFGEFVPLTAHEIHWRDHIAMQSVFQSHTDLAVSKTINMPEEATVEDIFNAYVLAWQVGCKGITVYRDKSRAKQVLTKVEQAVVSFGGDMGKKVEELSQAELDTEKANGRKRMLTSAKALRHKFSVGGMEGYVLFGLYEDGKPGEMFIVASKQGSTISGLLDSVAILTSMALQYGVPLEAIARKFRGTRFEPNGLTENKDIPMASSVLDYIFRYASEQFKIESKGQIETGTFCPECLSPVIYEENCQVCSVHCGWSRC